MALTEELPCELNQEELNAAAQELATTLGEIEAEEDAKADEASTHTAAIKNLRARASALALKIRAKTETRPVAVTEHVDVDAGVYYTTRDDTGARVHERPMTDDERQRTIPFPTPQHGDEAPGEPATPDEL